jgi:multidrug transporter EmrE-like cation transporter
MAYIFLALCVCFTVLGQLLLRYRVGGGAMSREGVGPQMFAMLQLFADPYVIGAVACAFAAMLSWMVTLARVPLSHAYPFTSFSYVLVAFAAWALFGEAPTFWRMVGVGLIVLGIVACGWGASADASAETSAFPPHDAVGQPAESAADGVIREQP